jgi:hypothetical protein
LLAAEAEFPSRELHACATKVEIIPAIQGTAIELQMA